jgi:hypothetical protein
LVLALGVETDIASVLNDLVAADPGLTTGFRNVVVADFIGQ